MLFKGLTILMLSQEPTIPMLLKDLTIPMLNREPLVPSPNPVQSIHKAIETLNCYKQAITFTGEGASSILPLVLKQEDSDFSEVFVA